MRAEHGAPSPLGSAAGLVLRGGLRGFRCDVVPGRYAAGARLVDVHARRIGCELRRLRSDVHAPAAVPARGGDRVGIRLGPALLLVRVGLRARPSRDPRAGAALRGRAHARHADDLRRGARESRPRLGIAAAVEVRGVQPAVPHRADVDRTAHVATLSVRRLLTRLMTSRAVRSKGCTPALIRPPGSGETNGMAEGRDSKEQSEFREYCRRWLAENRRGPRGSWATAGRRPLLGRVAELPTPDAAVSPIRASAPKRSPSSPR